ncbi:GNAT family N-acetyltransferase [Bradyrhizobium sp. G127]|jgi:GNAT superfamily N-acetyltransferase|uniref:GNAT family N-acetyltransferase n=1 Tax=Bradyrhizobium sp. G127 TaxID=2904800 RepID=UPI001F2008EB|nr:GNAT family N-acetyltransferase [Bradyrhizobium sp. G127]MCF2523502.1 GNAT family N-acetyltransferase [Bradyrhizobium sp. G127]MCR6734500.1 GNAT family N-acetyltransferase [Afipia sp.]
MTDRVVIRPVREDERAAWEPLWAGYLRFYKASVPTATTDITWQRFHDDAEPMYVLGAYVDGDLTGIVHFLYHRSCWTIGDYCYLQDLFVNENARGHGVGRKLIEAVYEKAKAAGASRVHWLTQFENARAQILYDEVADRSGFMQYRKIF